MTVHRCIWCTPINTRTHTHAQINAERTDPFKKRRSKHLRPCGQRSRKIKSTRAFLRADAADTSEEGLKRASISLCRDLPTWVYSAPPDVRKRADQKSERQGNVPDRQEAGDRDISAASPLRSRLPAIFWLWLWLLWLYLLNCPN